MKKMNFFKLQLLVTIISMLLLVFNRFFNLRIKAYASIVLLLLLLVTFIIKKISKMRKPQVVSLVLSIVLLVGSFAGFIGSKVIEGSLNGITTDKVEFSSVFVVTDESITSLSDLSGKKVGLLSDETSIEGYVLPKEKLDEMKVDYTLIQERSYLTLINMVNDGELDAIALPSNYKDTFSSMEEFTHLVDALLVIDTSVKSVEVEREDVESQILNLVLVGVDNPIYNNKTSGQNYDVIVLLSINKETFETKILSIPRDTYTNVTCMGTKDKINHSGWYGAECLMDSMTEMLEVPVSRYIVVDFNGLIDLVDAFNGVEIDVPYRIVEQDHNRNFDNLIVIEEGLQTLNGEQSLAFLRHRKTLEGGAIERSSNHMFFIESLVKQAMSPAILQEVGELLSIANENVVTNLSNDEVIELYNVVLDEVLKGNVTEIPFTEIALEGESDYIYHNGFKRELYYYVPSEKSISTIRQMLSY